MIKPQIDTDTVPSIKYGAGSAKLVPARFKQGAGIYFLILDSRFHGNDISRENLVLISWFIISYTKPARKDLSAKNY